MRGDAYMKAGRRTEAMADYRRVRSDAWVEMSRPCHDTCTSTSAGRETSICPTHGHCRRRRCDCLQLGPYRLAAALLRDPSRAAVEFPPLAEVFKSHSRMTHDKASRYHYGNARREGGSRTQWSATSRRRSLCLRLNVELLYRGRVVPKEALVTHRHRFGKRPLHDSNSGSRFPGGEN
jgi:hypothetical protein